MIKGLHHNAYRCRDSEETRGFYEDFLGLWFVSAFEIDEGRALHSFFEMDDGSCLTFFEVPGRPSTSSARTRSTCTLRSASNPMCSTECWKRRGQRGSRCGGRSIMGSSGPSTCAIRMATSWS
jgi:catechol 2,3-dioxygenase-like lactoylglutathione lyase family enzyme